MPQQFGRVLVDEGEPARIVLRRPDGSFDIDIDFPTGRRKYRIFFCPTDRNDAAVSHPDLRRRTTAKGTFNVEASRFRTCRNEKFCSLAGTDLVGMGILVEHVDLPLRPAACRGRHDDQRGGQRRPQPAHLIRRPDHPKSDNPGDRRRGSVGSGQRGFFAAFAILRPAPQWSGCVPRPGP